MTLTLHVDTQTNTVAVLLDGEDLIALSGGEWLHLNAVAMFSQGDLLETTALDKRVQLLCCTCGDEDCGSLSCRVSVSDESVTWHDFSDGKDRVPLAEFVFARSQYEEALAVGMTACRTPLLRFVIVGGVPARLYCAFDRRPVFVVTLDSTGHPRLDAGLLTRVRDGHDTREISSAEHDNLLKALSIAEIRRLGHDLGRFLRDSPSADVLATSHAYTELVEIFAGERLPAELAVNFAFANNGAVASAALEGIRKNGARSHQVALTVAERSGDVPSLAMGQALMLVADQHPAVPAGLPLVRLAMASRLKKSGWVDGPLGRALDAYVSWYRSLGSREIEVGDDPTAMAEDDREALRIWLRRMADLPAYSDATSDNSVLSKVGTFWEASTAAPAVDVVQWADAGRRIITSLQASPPRSVLVVGGPGVGKTSFLRRVFLNAATAGWRVFEAGSQGFIADNIYIGQTEGLVRSVVRSLDLRQKIVWYVPDILTFAQTGAHKHNNATLLEQIAPAVRLSQIVLWAECDARGAERLFRLHPWLRRSIEVVTLESLSASATNELARSLGEALSSRLSMSVQPTAAAAAVELADRYLTTLALPGAALGVLEDACNHALQSGFSYVGRREVATAMSEMSGLPLSILNGEERLEVSDLTAFFAKRVIGQPDAVKSVVDRVVMLKGGLNDPRKPIGTLLFAGPTGTGKTELAKAAAEYLFGDAGRLLRLDMSEFMLEQSTQKILGGPLLPEHGETLIDRIRRQPYSVLLLDEFEKAHPVVWDLFLQLLDEGRLTDFKGATADFRNCLIILTTNLGATAHRRAALGFQAGASAFNADQVRDAIGSVFRPEFQNRFDAIVVFNPLTRGVMKQILVKELERLYERRGLRQRGWAAEWESSAIEFLLERGFHPEMGARPLKRAIDEYVAVPLATAIVEERAPSTEHFAFFRSDGSSIQVEFVDPDDTATNADELLPWEDPRSARTIAASSRPVRGDVASLREALDGIAEHLSSSEWVEVKGELQSTMGVPDFWTRPDRVDVLTRFEVMDRLEMAVESAATLCGRLARRQKPVDDGWRNDVLRLATMVVGAQEGVVDWEEKCPVDVAIQVEPALDGNPANRESVSAWCQTVRQMYAGWARHRLLAHQSVTGHESTAVISGFGAFRSLCAEAGLHVFEDSSEGGETARIAARVVVGTVPGDPGAAGDNALPLVLAALEAQPRLTTVVRRYRRLPSPLVRSGDGRRRTGKLDAVLSGRLDLIRADDA